MTHILHRTCAAELPVAVHGHGVELVDESGRTYLDASGGAAVSCLGHGHPDVIAALHKQADQLAFAHTGFFTSRPAEQLADFLAGVAPGNLDYVYYVCGGSEAVETALKMARQYCVERGETGRSRVIARWQSYHGNTVGALSAGGNVQRRKVYAPMLLQTCSHIPPCYAYRYRMPGESDAEYAERAAAALEDEILRLGPETVMAFIAETVVGATSGAVPPVGDYFRRIRQICDRYGVLLILDEVMCGMGRTGTLFAFEQEGIVPDLVCIAKGLGAGYQPIGAVMLGSHIYDAFAGGSGAFQHGHTYVGHPMPCAAALAVQTVIRRDGLLANVRAMGEALRSGLRDRFTDNPFVGDIRGRGLFVGIELVRDRETRATFDPELKLHARIKRKAMENGLMVYPGGGTADGTRGDHVLLAPPFICDLPTIREIVDRLGTAVDAALADAGFPVTGRSQKGLPAESVVSE